MALRRRLRRTHRQRAVGQRRRITCRRPLWDPTGFCHCRRRRVCPRISCREHSDHGRRRDRGHRHDGEHGHHSRRQVHRDSVALTRPQPRAAAPAGEPPFKVAHEAPHEEGAPPAPAGSAAAGRRDGAPLRPAPRASACVARTPCALGCAPQAGPATPRRGSARRGRIAPRARLRHVLEDLDQRI